MAVMNNKPVAVITGASRGIGRMTTKALASEGFDIVAIAQSIHSDNMLSLQSEVEQIGAQFLPIGLDISHTSEHADAINTICNHYGRIDLLVNNAGVAPYDSVDFLSMKEESFDRVMTINLKGPLFFTQKIAQCMVWLKKHVASENDYSIIFVSSLSAEMTSVDRGEYCISKAGLSMVSSLFADRLEGEGINVYELRPGLVKTDMTKKARIKYEESGNGNKKETNWAEPTDVAKAIVSLARGDWKFSTGSVFEMAGGLNFKRMV